MFALKQKRFLEVSLKFNLQTFAFKDLHVHGILFKIKINDEDL